jgi:hypothetical protein
MMSESPGYQMLVILMEVQLLSVLSILGSHSLGVLFSASYLRVQPLMK